MIVNQLACMEAGCPDATAGCGAAAREAAAKLMFKIYKAAKDLSSEEVEAAMKRAIAEEAGGGEHERGHAEPVAAKGRAAATTAASTSTATASTARGEARRRAAHGHAEKHD